MKVSRVAVLLFTIAAIASHADETNLTLTVDGVTYSNVTFGTVTPASVSFTHSTGAASIPLERLSPDLQKRFGYDPKEAEQYRQAEAKRKAAAQAQRKKVAKHEAGKREATRKAQAEAAGPHATCNEAKPVRERIAQVFKDGLLVEGDNGLVRFLKGQVPIAAAGDNVNCWAYLDGTHTYQSSLGASATVQLWVYCEPITIWQWTPGGLMVPVR